MNQVDFNGGFDANFLTKLIYILVYTVYCTKQLFDLYISRFKRLKISITKNYLEYVQL